jgi:hypothetical protein
LDRLIAPEGTPANVRNAASFKLLVAVAARPNSMLIERFNPPLVALPPIEISPEDTIVMVRYLTVFRMQSHWPKS